MGATTPNVRPLGVAGSQHGAGHAPQPHIPEVIRPCEPNHETDQARVSCHRTVQKGGDIVFEFSFATFFEHDGGDHHDN